MLFDIPSRFPSSAKSAKMSHSEATPAKGSLTLGKLTPQIETSAPLQEIDLVYPFIYLLYFLFFIFFWLNDYSCKCPEVPK